MMDIIEQLKRDEGVRLKPYKDSVGILTIGIGRNLEAVGISMDEAMSMLMNDVSKVRAQLSARLPWYKSLDEARRGVLENMAFNLGIDGLLKFKQTIALIEGGKYDDAATAMLQSKWAVQVGKRADRLANQMRSGIWQ